MIEAFMTRRQTFTFFLAAASFSCLVRVVPSWAQSFEVTKSDSEWKKLLTPEQFHVLREQGTERPNSSALTHEHADGTYKCAACELPLFSSKTKFDSGTGWPSFFQPLPNATASTSDTSMFMQRVEIHCRRCGSHLGHVFDDGPPPTGKRYCMNGVALTFVPGLPPV